MVISTTYRLIYKRIHFRLPFTQTYQVEQFLINVQPYRCHLAWSVWPWADSLGPIFGWSRPRVVLSSLRMVHRCLGLWAVPMSQANPCCHTVAGVFHLSFRPKIVPIIQQPATLGEPPDDQQKTGISYMKSKRQHIMLREYIC